jgi:endonuclease III
MIGFNIPLNFSDENFYDNNRKNEEDYDNNYDKMLKNAISDFIRLLIMSPNGSFKPDQRFGFSLNNCHFITTNSKDEIKGKKIGGKSDNLNNYAKDLEKTIKLFETRLQNVVVRTNFVKEKSKIVISISGMVIETKKEYYQDIEFFIWNNYEDIRRV